ncbi:SMP-30/gluconolactonase/LRE family protein [Janibacter sp. YIM B02568]|uniref:SMP-30/gluconolactonase/LRE family protein n=1 Tax=Janibacter endophyticus TaxID=2806261 RepID=UPI00194E1918|nr:SMP-30/gluconolactonase/LRE family protein [Janibacter endophyticus]MBM6546745.1 SMP-30/gluconolactonase/LRE family protein [Janibacter endophyticus]
MSNHQITIVGVPGPGAEDVLVGDDGTVWTGTADGAIHALDPAGGSTRRVARTGGRPLGLEWLPDGRLLVCDAERGLLAVSTEDGALEELVTEVDGERLRFTNNAAVAEDGTIWFSDSSRRWGVREWKSDLIEHTRSGRLFRRDPGGRVETVLDGLAFANGVALAADGSAVYVAETALRRVRRVGLAGGRPSGDQPVGSEGMEATLSSADLLVDDLPGYPDNIARGSDGLVWVTIASPPDPVLGLLQTRASQRVRALALRLPDALKPAPQRTVRVQAYDGQGALRHDLEGDATDWHMATGVREHDGRVWLGSLVEPAVAWLEV